MLSDPVTIRRDDRARSLLAIAVLGYIMLFVYWTNRQQDAIGTQAFDLGIYDQGVWLLSHLKSPFVTINGRQLFGDHTTFILIPFAVVYRVIDSAKVLLTVQSVALGLGAIPAFLIAREKLGNEAQAAALSVVYLLHPVLGWTNLEHFHPDALEIPLVLLTMYFVVKERWIRYFVCVALLLLTKEDVALLTLALGVYVALKHNRRVGQITAAVSGVYLILAFWWILPAFNGVGTVYGGRVPFGGPGGFLRRLLTHPGEVVAYVLARKRFFYLWQLFLPVAFAAWLAPSVLLIASAPLAVNMIASFGYQYDIHFHYSTLILPMIIVATIFGIARFTDDVLRRLAVGAVVVASVVTAFLWGPTPLWKGHPFIADPNSELVASFRQAERHLPKDAIVSAYYGWIPQISHREEVYMFPNPWKASYWGT
ncbi:MAG: DUF2079 domain-containing protein, partial [Actinobacteria bacterium]|nr:DUF2079 domain-containing protein [Actinomycetota bacterium]